jgi:CubicO group peptidase (beta-lactamase class C family)
MNQEALKSHTESQVNSSEIDKILNSFLNEDNKNKLIPSKGLECIITVNGYKELERTLGGGLMFIDNQEVSKTFEAGKVFDLGNMTGGIITTLLTLHAASLGIIDLNHRVSRILQGFGANGKEEMTIKNLLLHQSGFPEQLIAHRVLVQGKPELDRLHPRRSSLQLLQNEIFRTRLLNLPGKVTLHSNLNYMVLGFILEQVFGMSVSKLFDEKIARPLGLRSCSYIDYEMLRREGINVNTSDIVPTAKCNWRGKLIVGETQDEVTWALGGVSAHSGLFSSLSDLQTLGQVIVQIINNESPFLGISAKSMQEKGIPNATLLSDILTKQTISKNELEFYVMNSNTGVSLWLNPASSIVFTIGSNLAQTTKDYAAFNRMNRAIIESI